MDLSNRPSIRGQLEGPISFGFNILDQDERPILFDDTVRSFLLEFMAKRINVQLDRLKVLNQNAFMFVDEPGLQFIFSAMAGYGDLKAKEDLGLFFSMTERPCGIHLCGNPDWDFLLGLDLDVLSLDIYTNFVEFCLSATSRLSIADEKRASIKSCCGKGITLALEVENIDKAGLNPTRIRKHAWNARVFYLFDPERHRIEIWESINAV